MPIRRTALANSSLALALLVVAGCASVRTASVAPEKQVRAIAASALTGRQPSPATRQLLRLALLEDLADEEPKRAIRSLVGLYDRQWGPAGMLEPATAAAELAIIEGRRLEESGNARDACGYYLTAAELAQDAALRAVRGEVSALSPRARMAAELYNFSVGRLVALMPSTAPSRAFDGPLGTYQAELAGSGEPWDPDVFSLRPADEIRVRGLRNRHRHHGLGSPLVASRRLIPERPVPEGGFFEFHDNCHAVTAVARFLEPRPGPRADTPPGRHRRVVFELHDPLVTEKIMIEDLEIPLEADFTAPLAVLTESMAERKNPEAAALRTGRYLDQAGLYLLEPFRSDKIPLVLVHGLQASSLTWIEMINDLWGDSELRRHYQIWAFYYPTGLPFSFSAGLLRSSLEQTLEHFDPEGNHMELHRMVMIGHSMGGLLVRSLAVRSDGALWDAVATRPLEELDLPAEDLEWLRRVFSDEPLPELARAIFISTPHRGAEMAAGPLGRFVSSLVRLPEILVEQFVRLLEADVLRDPQDLDGPADVFDSLAPESPILVALSQLENQVPFHSVIGDRNRSDEEISDGFVTYRSSHLAGAESEKIITAGHNAHQDPKGIAEVRRILRLHLRSIDRGARAGKKPAHLSRSPDDEGPAWP